MEHLKQIAKEIRDLLEMRRKQLCLTFVEETHTYTMLDSNNNLRSNFPSVSKLIDKFYTPFDKDSKSFQMCNGDLIKQRELLNEWQAKGDYATNMGSRVHYELERDLINQYDSYKEVRKPIFSCDANQINIGNNMIAAGKLYLDVMHQRQAVLLDTEMVLGDDELGYVGQPDKAWLMYTKDKQNIGLVITDWKTNQPKNFEVMPWTGNLYSPFQEYNDTALQHYYLQLPLYAKLILKMLQNTKYSNISLLGCVVVLLKADGTYQEYKVPVYFNQTILSMEMKNYL